MSNLRAIAAVSAVLSEIVRNAISGVVSSAQVFTLRPHLALRNGNVGVNVYLFRAVPNPSLRNLSQPVRSADGRLVRRPLAAWDLHYLLTCIGNEASLQPDLLLGAVVTHLEAVPLLGHGIIRSVEGALSEEDDHQGARNSGLAEQVDLVRLTPLDLSLDSLIQLWSALTNEPFALSVAYQAAAVLMAPEVALSAALPVAGQPAGSLSLASQPHIDAAVAASGRNDAITIASRLVIEGSKLRGPFPQVKIGSLTIDLDPSAIRDDRIEVELSPDTGSGPTPLPLAPGVLGVRVRHQVDISSDPSAPTPRPGPTSNVVPITLRPRIEALELTPVERAIRLVIAPAPDPKWEMRLLLNRARSDPPESLVLDAGSIEEGRLVFDGARVPQGSWLVRVQVNGADSPLTLEAGVFSGPLLEVPP